MLDTTPGTVTAALDVHKSSVRLAAVHRGELVAEQTLPYDHEAVYRDAATRVTRERQLPTVTSLAVSTRESQSDPPSLPGAVRRSRPRGDPQSIRAGPLDRLLHLRANGALAPCSRDRAVRTSAPGTAPRGG